MILNRTQLLMVPFIAIFLLLPHIGYIRNNSELQVKHPVSSLELIHNPTIQSEWPIPSKLSAHNVHYENASHIKGWSCGFNCLINAARLEERAGLEQSHGDLDRFSAVVMPIISKKGIKSTDGAPFSMIEELSEILKLGKSTVLLNEDGKINYYNPAPVAITDNDSTVQAEIEKMIAHALEMRTLEQFKNLKEYLDKKIDKPVFLHFFCHIVSKQEHIILISLKKDVDNKITYYVRDNMNKEITADGQVSNYLEFLINQFNK